MLTGMQMAEENLKDYADKKWEEGAERLSTQKQRFRRGGLGEVDAVLDVPLAYSRYVFQGFRDCNRPAML